jgi:hypothetical protein
VRDAVVIAARSQEEEVEENDPHLRSVGDSLGPSNAVSGSIGFAGLAGVFARLWVEPLGSSAL